MVLEYQGEQNIRVDKYLSTCFDVYTRTHIQKMIKEESITVNGKPIKASYSLEYGDLIELIERTPILPEILPQNLPIDIVYEDDDLVIVNKARGMVVHPAPGNYSGTLVNAIMYHCKDRLSSINGEIRPGIVHRIDKDTSGLLIICKNDKSHASIAAQLKDHTTHRVYEAICYHDVTKNEGIIDAPIGRSERDRKKMAINFKNGKEARTHYQVLERLDEKRYTYLTLKLETGRTHQIRVHMASIGNPLVGDPVYGPVKGAFSANGQMLHAKEVGFIHPSSGNYMEFHSELPDDFQHILDILRKRRGYESIVR